MLLGTAREGKVAQELYCGQVQYSLVQCSLLSSLVHCS